MKSQVVPIEGVSKVPAGGRVARHCYLKLSLDGNQWCALFGADLQGGVAGFGDTPTEAVYDFEEQFKTAARNGKPAGGRLRRKRFGWTRCPKAEPITA